jgi:hypothetical protein
VLHMTEYLSSGGDRWSVFNSRDAVNSEEEDIVRTELFCYI